MDHRAVPLAKLRAWSPCLLVLLSLLLPSPAYCGSGIGAGSIEIVGSFTGSHSETTQDDDNKSNYIRGDLELDVGIGYFLTDRFEFLPRISWTSTSRGTKGEWGSSGGASYYGITGLLVLNHPTRRAGILFFGFGAGISASKNYEVEPVQVPILEGGTRLLLGDSVSLNFSAYYERLQNYWGWGDSSVSEYGLRAGFSIFPLGFLGAGGEEE